MAGMYNHLPMEDYHYDTNSNGTEIGGGYYVGNGLSVWTFWNSTGEMVNRNNTGMTYHRSGYWGGGFKVIRQANTLITSLPNYPELANQSKSWIAEAKFTFNWLNATVDYRKYLSLNLWILMMNQRCG